MAITLTKTLIIVLAAQWTKEVIGKHIKANENDIIDESPEKVMSYVPYVGSSSRKATNNERDGNPKGENPRRC